VCNGCLGVRGFLRGSDVGLGVQLPAVCPRVHHDAETAVCIGLQPENHHGLRCTQQVRLHCTVNKLPESVESLYSRA
jgi:hypothetical protein